VRQLVKTQNPLNGELSHGIISQAVHQEFKLAAVRRLEAGVSLAEAAGALEVNPNVLHRWRVSFGMGPAMRFPHGHGQARWSEERITKLERKIGQQALEIDFLKKCLQRIEEQRMQQVLSIERMESWAGVSRSGFYCFHGDAGAGP